MAEDDTASDLTPVTAPDTPSSSEDILSDESIDELYSKNPTDLSRAERDQIVAKLRSQADQWLKETQSANASGRRRQRSKGAKAPKPPTAKRAQLDDMLNQLDLDDLK